jgi:glycosyltransferase involved in cell wall biosynthesis
MSQFKDKNNKKLPFVSICSPTFNRRPFIPYLIKCIELQTYPMELMEWIIIDDGSDKVKDIIDAFKLRSNGLQVKYFECAKQLTLGNKRNVMHDKCTGEIIVYMDDDDYYPPERVSHAVETLLANPAALCAGSSEMHIYFDHIKTLYQCGPYGPNHATAATFAFRRGLLARVRYDDESAVAEEKHFLQNYTIPFVQLDATKTILVFAHIHNSVDKKTLIESPNKYIQKSPKQLYDFFTISDNETINQRTEELRRFYVVNLNEILAVYTLGKPDLKPEMMKQINNMTEERKKILGPLQELHEQMQKQFNVQLQEVRASYEQALANKDYLIQMLMKQNKELKESMKESKK